MVCPKAVFLDHFYLSFTVFGGYSSVFLDDFEYYDEDKDAWYTIPNMKTL